MVGSLGTACGKWPKSPAVASLGKTTSTTAVARAGQPTINQTVHGQDAGLHPLHAQSRHYGLPGTHSGPNGQGGGFSIKAGPGSDLNPNDPRYEAADRECKALLPYGGTPPPPTAAQLAEYTKFSDCIRHHGFPSFPDPTSHVFVLHNF